ncbi:MULTISPECIES: transcriptional regulator, SarA/Rot family [Mammaliicoccus]|uniref:MarR family transcriptional regulator n=1 Tax=Mammaliicoccus lentus TaxID=42858 RepID=A0AAX3W183_MAMLE|nr:MULTISPECIES: MarR family transcriptional regulator [Mammaliicoccus]HBV02725.1 transcriptional regulator [Staphylococcus sp.]MBF0793646.1 MarR family transcriptional regulator [Mammaliicoccus lentus]MBU6113814.1 MarR family transcriptional regulator [Mammaliicoccus lentus]MBW0767783.1 MarR family transcriptional regulator [Mammaliicoccus lentus]MDQ7143516.1 MarR family transcriptional regulator [Mammaliicoccus lentus]
MGYKEGDISDLILLDDIQKNINNIFDNIEEEFQIEKEEFLTLVVLWNKGSMSLKELDEHIDIKPYKRTRLYNNLVKKGWIKKTRPEDDERTVIVEVNQEFDEHKNDLIKYACEEIKKRQTLFEEQFKSIVNTCNI